MNMRLHQSHMMPWSWLTVFTLLLVIFLTASVYDTKKTTYISQSRNDITHPHLVDIWWNIGKAREFSLLETDVDYSATLKKHSNVYVSPIFGAIGGIDFYFGQATRIGDAYATPASSDIIELDSCLIFARWNTLRRDYVRLARNGYLYTTPFENGDYVSSRTLNKQEAGSFTYSISKVPPSRGDAKGEQWYSCFVTNRATGKISQGGMIRIDDNNKLLDEKICSFIEVFKKPDEANSNYKVSFSNIRINNLKITPISIEAIYPRGSRAWAKAYYKDGAIVVEVEENKMINKDERRIELK